MDVAVVDLLNAIALSDSVDIPEFSSICSRVANYTDELLAVFHLIHVCGARD